MLRIGRVALRHSSSNALGASPAVRPVVSAIPRQDDGEEIRIHPWSESYEIGTDICEISRVATLLRGDERKRFAFLRQFLRQSELRLLHSENPGLMVDPYSQERSARTGRKEPQQEEENENSGKVVFRTSGMLEEFLAGRYVTHVHTLSPHSLASGSDPVSCSRWAAKEACVKATHGRLNKLNFEISKSPLGHDGQLIHLDRIRFPRVYCWLPLGMGQPKTAIEGRISISHDGGFATAVALFQNIHPHLDRKLRVRPRGIHRVLVPAAPQSADPSTSNREKQSPQ